MHAVGRMFSRLGIYVVNVSCKTVGVAHSDRSICAIVLDIRSWFGDVLYMASESI